jgi:sulfatase modifying factor 1
MKKHIPLPTMLLAMLCLAAGTPPPTEDPLDALRKSMIEVKGGTFTMGSQDGDEDEKPVHKVKLSTFWISAFEITNKEYALFLNEQRRALKIDAEEGEVTFRSQIIYDFICGDCDDSNDQMYFDEDDGFTVVDGFENYPVSTVTWHGAKAFCDWLSKKTGEKFRLPTEAEWEFAARGGKKTNNYSHAGSNDADEIAWFEDNSDGGPQEVGQKSPNELGIFDMTGNVWEHCSDWYGDYSSETQKDPKGPSEGEDHVTRGGAYDIDEYNSRVATRAHYHDVNGFRAYGFRIVRQ